MKCAGKARIARIQKLLSFVIGSLDLASNAEIDSQLTVFQVLGHFQTLMAEAHSNSQLYYFGISPYLSSENALARFSWGLAETEKSLPEIQTEIALALEPVVIPSHLWWRPDAEEIILGCQPYSAKLKLQIGPGFELKTHGALVHRALQLGYRLQVLIQAPLNPEQRNRLQALLQSFQSQIEFVFLWQEAQTDSLRILEELKKLSCENLSLGLTKKSWSHIYPELKKEALRQLPVYDFEHGTVSVLSEVLEQTGWARKTTEFRSSRFQFPVKELFRLLSHLFLLILAPGKKNLGLLQESSKVLITNVYWFLVQKVYWDFLHQIQCHLFRKSFVKQFLNRFYWKLYWLVTTAAGQTKAVQVRFFWFSYGLVGKVFDWCKRYPLWPLRKLYWFSKYQFEKRVMKS